MIVASFNVIQIVEYFLELNRHYILDLLKPIKLLPYPKLLKSHYRTTNQISLYLIAFRFIV